MSGLASREQLRMGLARWMMVTVPAIVFLGFLSGRLAGPSGEGGWYQALVKPEFQPPVWVFPVAWTILYALLGVALAMIIHARGAKGRRLALGLFGAQLLLNLAWSPVFFGAHQVTLAFALLLAIFVLATATAYSFYSIRRVAGLLLLPYLAWLAFASILNFEIDRLNPDAELLVPAAPQAEMAL